MSDLQTSTLEDMCEFIIDCPHFTPDWTNSGFIVVRNQNIRDGKLDLSQPSFTHREDFERRIKRAKPQAGDIIFTREAPMGEVCMVPEGLECCLGQRQVLLRPKRTIDGRYLFFALRSAYVRHQIFWNEGTGSTVSNIRIPVIKALKIPRLGSTENYIGELLGALDDKIDLNRRTNETLEQTARAIFKDWFVDFGPTRAKMAGQEPHLSADLWALFPERWDEVGVPEGWTTTTVGDAFHLTMGQSPPGNTYNEDGEGLPFFQGRTDFGFRYPDNRMFCTAPTRIAEASDTLVSVRAPVGDINLAWEKSCIGRGVAALSHPSGSWSFTYHAAWSLQVALRQYEHTGTVFGAINKKQFENLKLVAPNVELVRAFQQIAGPLDERVRTNTAEARTLAQTRDLLLPKLMSGELRVREAEAQVAEVL